MKGIFRVNTGMAILVAVLTVFSNEALGEELFKRVTFIVRPDVVVKGEEVRLQDIATFGPSEKEFQDLLAKVKSLRIADAPTPKSKTVILGASILQALNDSDLPKESIGYSIPKLVNIERDGRVISKEEVLSELKLEMSKRKNTDVQIRDVEWANSQVVPTGSSKLSVEILGDPVSGKFPIRAEVFVNEKPSARFLATAVADDWREIPILSRSIERGSLINPEDIHLVRMNLAGQPADAVSAISELFGKRAKARLPAGDVVRKSFIDIPPLVPKGKRISVVYDRGALRATATGIALEDGFEGSRIMIRNENSKKLITGKVKNAEEVEAAN